MSARGVFVRAALLAVALAECARPSPSPTGPELLRAKVVRTFPHDPRAFTQGLEYHDGWLYESTGLYGQSSLRKVDPQSGVPEVVVPIDGGIFAEGLTRIGGSLLQLSWREGRAVLWRLSSFEREREFPYQGEGWGVCYDGKRLVMSNGTATLQLRDPETFAKLGEIAVRRQGVPVANLNELECVGDVVYANVWQDEHIARIDARTGEVTGWIDARGLLRDDERGGVDVLNGIAWVPERRRFIVTGKLWPKAFEVELVPAAP